ncbi:Cytochrome c oxidase polypeptide III [Minicystis rosea]|nr:Cytochrome c oxidase polypeptide III [Minicystis rosea]
MRAPTLHEHFADLDKQQHASRLGMWIFLGSEAMLFTGLFALYAAYRVMYPVEFAAGVSKNNLALGTINLFILLTASLTAMLALLAVRAGAPRRATVLFLFTALSGVVFLVLKGTEYVQHFQEGIVPGPAYHFAELPSRGANLFFTLYYYATGLHAIHLLVGIGLMVWVAWGCQRGIHTAADPVRVENSVLYWHMVDIFWMFLWPLFYLTRL